MLAASIGLFLLAANGQSVLAANEAQAVGVDPDAMARNGQAERTLVVGADISVGERIVTGPTGKVQLLFTDQTHLVVGPGSSLLIESYLMNGSATDRFVVNALAGTFRFVTGNGPKSAYTIKTPSAAIAIRGTGFDLNVGPQDSQVMLYKGAVEMCQGKDCVEITGRCDIGVFGKDGPKHVGWGDATRSSLLGNFPLSGLQSTLASAFRVSGANACRFPPPDEAPESLVRNPSSDSDSQGMRGVPGVQGGQGPNAN